MICNYIGTTSEAKYHCNSIIGQQQKNPSMEKGEKGEKGGKGEKGDKGEKGASAVPN